MKPQELLVLVWIGFAGCTSHDNSPAPMPDAPTADAHVSPPCQTQYKCIDANTLGSLKCGAEVFVPMACPNGCVSSGTTASCAP